MCRSFDLDEHHNELQSKLLFRDIVKTLQTCYFEYFENAWSCPSPSPSRFHDYVYHLVEIFDAQNVEINLQETLMFLYLQKVSFISNFFLEVL